MVMLLLWVEAMEGSKGYMRGEVGEVVDVEEVKVGVLDVFLARKTGHLRSFKVFLQVFPLLGQPDTVGFQQVENRF